MGAHFGDLWYTSLICTPICTNGISASSPLGPNANSPGISCVTLVTWKLGSHSSVNDGIRSPEALQVNGMPWVAELGMMASQQRQDPVLRGAAKT